MYFQHHTFNPVPALSVCKWDIYFSLYSINRSVLQHILEGICFDEVYKICYILVNRLLQCPWELLVNLLISFFFKGSFFQHFVRKHKKGPKTSLMFQDTTLCSLSALVRFNTNIMLMYLELYYVFSSTFHFFFFLISIGKKIQCKSVHISSFSNVRSFQCCIIIGILSCKYFY